MIRILAIVILCNFVMPPALALESQPLEGSTFLGEESCANGIKSADCVLSFQIDGKVAAQLYKGMRVKAHRDECADADVKDDGNGLRCYDQGSSGYSCDFGYSFKSKQFGSSEVTC